MRVTIVAGSQRAGAQSSKVARYIHRYLANRFETPPSLVDLSERPLPWMDDSFDPALEPWSSRWAPIASELQASEAVVLVTPEWGGMASPAMKNFLLICSCGSELRHKPCLIVSVSGGAGGTYPVAELRMSASKNSQACFIPVHVIVRNVKTRLNDELCEDAQDQELRARLHHALDILAEYGRALRAVRESAVVRESRYRGGM